MWGSTPNPFAAPPSAQNYSAYSIPQLPAPQYLHAQAKFNDLPDSIKADITRFHAFMKGLQEDSHELEQATEKVREQHPKIRDELAEMLKRYIAFRGTLEQGLGFVGELAKDVAHQQQSIQMAREILQGTRQPGPPQQRYAQQTHALSAPLLWLAF